MSLVLVMGISSTLLGQQPRPVHHFHPVIEEIEADYRRGAISIDQKVLYKLYAGIKPEALPEVYRAKLTDPIKCGTPAIIDFFQNREELSAAARSEIEKLLSGTEFLGEEYDTSNGRFVIYYETSGNDAVPPVDNNGNGTPDYVEWVAAAADSSWRHEVARLGFSDPVVEDSSPYPIFIENIGIYYGLTGKGLSRGLNSETYIAIHNNFNGFPENTDPEGDQKGAIKVTMAHELKHAIQFENSEWYGSPVDTDNPHSISWSEMDAVFMEEVVYDNVNDYYNYLNNGSSIFKSFNHFIPASYSGVTWFIFMAEKYGIQVWVDIWDLIQQEYEAEKGNTNPQFPKMIDTIDEVLRTDYSDFYQNALAESHLWHFASGPNFSAPSFGFEERGSYPDPSINDELLGIIDIFSDTLEVQASSANYYLIEPVLVDIGNITVSIDAESAGLSISMLFYFKDGGVEALSVPLVNDGITTYNSIWKWEEVDKLGVIVSNGGPEDSSYRYKVFSTTPEELQLTQNFPNPFNPTTTIRFTIPQESDVQLKVYDIAGRLVQTLIDERLEADFYEVFFNADNLASGIYLYRLNVGNETVTKKMTLIK